ncbi:NAD(P)-dependent alcohol dehydrogenase [Kitasatospora sp. NBC_01560]|uniref:NAD(P)-dependent alcohol dehydrogenase n=1 Tax=Kitasatospora sp. NBC_01560 TaxID=2975965 RepID=UPI0038693C72
MKAITQHRYGTCDVLELGEIEAPAPGAGEVLIRVRAAGVDAGVWHLMTGLPRLLRLMGYGLRAPKVRVRGREVAGVVETVGAGVTRFRPGDEVFGICEGSFAEYAVASEEKLAATPAGLPLEHAAALAISGLTALQALRDAGRVEPGQRVLVIGAGGGVGNLAVQLAKASGAYVTGVCSTGKTDLVRSIGADEVVDYTREEVTDGRHRHDLVIDTAGSRPVSHLRRALTPRGTLVIVGGETGGRWTGGVGRVLRAALLNLFVGQTLRGVMTKEVHEDLAALARHVESGTLTPVVDGTYGLDRAAEAITRQHRGQARGKILLTP